MENNQLPNNMQQQPQSNPSPTMYQVPTISQVPAPTSNYNVGSLVIFVLLILTFFSPLGSVLFLPLLIVGFISAVKHTKTSSAGQPSAPVQPATAKSVGFLVLKVIIGVCAVIGIGILGLMGLLFILFSTGSVRMGS